ncbi:MAG: signal peptidase II [Candidatus Eremiobacteraeota bacterium]|nr:signal peptidase II [Candidatus Eremiobacteraeota bacterium]
MRGAALALLALIIIVVDHLTKAWVATHFLPGESRIVIPHVLYLTYVQNYHGAFGLFGTHPLLLTAAASAVLIGFYLWYRKEGAATVVHIAFALIFGGAVGNIIDRLRFGYVHDFIDLRFWPVFNVADSAITIGVVMLLGQMLVREKHHGAARAPHPAAPQDTGIAATAADAWIPHEQPTGPVAPSDE